ncbi:unnamed protein product [Amoebophrya sp. A120]|nr:unnamed protein product [Amoebophrya sp. A120]|eukprot:GSA120T00004947001.1
MAKNKPAAAGHELSILKDKETDFAEWYPEVIKKGELIEYYEISGCYILRPYAFFMWEQIQAFIDSHIKKLGVQNSYFPLFVSKDALEKEKDHVEGFAPEVAWVTHAGESPLPKPIAIRPTSETIMYPAYAKWIRSHRDLPLKLNQWTSVVRWEFKYPTPFIRTREFLWQEGHTAHASMEDAEKMVLDILDLYEKTYEEVLAVPVVKGVKSEKEKFAGGYMTTTVEAFIPTNGRAVQGATSHHLGENFSKMFHIQFEDEKGKKQYAAQTSWGFTTRSIGTMIMVHGDNTGLVLPPKVAQKQVVFVPIPGKKLPWEQLGEKCHDLAKPLEQLGVRVHVDDRKNYNPGYKYNHWEMKGVPIRLEVGERDLEQNVVTVVTRYNKYDADFKKFTIPFDELEKRIPKLLEEIHAGMLKKATVKRNEMIMVIKTWEEMKANLDKKTLFLCPWCETIESEEEIKDLTKQISEQNEKKVAENNLDENGEEFAPALSGAIKTLCIPLIQPEMPVGQKCFFKKDQPAKRWVLMGRSY